MNYIDLHIDIKASMEYQEFFLTQDGEALFPIFFTDVEYMDIQVEFFTNTNNPSAMRHVFQRISQSMEKIYRYLSDSPMGKEEFIEVNSNKKQYLNGEGEDFKFAAWALVHAYLLPGIVDPARFKRYMPIGKDMAVVNKWNQIIRSIPNTDKQVLELFVIEENGKAKVLDYIYAWADEWEIEVVDRCMDEISDGFYPSKAVRCETTKESED